MPGLYEVWKVHDETDGRTDGLVFSWMLTEDSSVPLLVVNTLPAYTLFYVLFYFILFFRF